jgi:transcriptional regulator with XRE-family HTH domain
VSTSIGDGESGDTSDLMKVGHEHPWEKVRALREACGFTQPDLEQRSNGGLSRSEVSKIETGKNKLRTVEIRDKVAGAFRVPRSTLEEYLDGSISLARMVALVGSAPRATAPATPTATIVAQQGASMGVMLERLRASTSRYPNLARCLDFYGAEGKHWSTSTVAAAEAGLFGEDDMPPSQWTQRLDMLEKLHLGLQVQFANETRGGGGGHGPGRSKPLRDTTQ